MKQKKHPFKLLDYADVLRSIPAMDIKNVSLVSRGLKRSKQTPRGFLETWVSRRGNTNFLNESSGFGTQTWNQRRTAFIRRHTKQAKTNGEKYWKQGKPTRRHLGLIAWGYTPTRKRLKTWLLSQPTIESGTWKLGLK